MAQVELPPGIAAIHGKLGNMIFRSRKQADGSYKVFVHEYRGMKGERLEARGERKKKGERRGARGERKKKGERLEVRGERKKSLSKHIDSTLEGHR